MPFSHLPQIATGHAAIKDYLAYRDNLHGNPERLIPIEGLWAHGIALQLGLSIRTAFVCPPMLRSPDYIKTAQEVMAKAGRTFVVSEKTFDKLSERDGPSGIASTVAPTNIYPDLAALPAPVVGQVHRWVIMDAVEVPGNIGTLLRALDGLGQAALILTNRRVRLTHPKVVKGSLGAIFSVPIVSASLEETLVFLQTHKIPLYTADSSPDTTRKTASRPADSQHMDFAAARVPERFGLLLGSEKYGIPPQVYAGGQATSIAIPMTGICDSLNVAIAGAVMLYGLVYRK